MKRFEYIRLAFDLGDLDELNGLSSVGFHVVDVMNEIESVEGETRLVRYALLERELPEKSGS